MTPQSTIKRLVSVILFVGLSTALLYGAPQMGDDKAPAQAMSAQSMSAQTITGCLKKGTEPGGFFLISNENKHWELYPEAGVDLAKHVGHTVSVTGTVAHRTAAQEEKSQPSEKKEMGKLAHADLDVSSVKHISATCSK
jgi:hypothetical protein